MTKIRLSLTFILAFATCSVLAQTLFHERNPKKPSGKLLSINAEIIDGRSVPRPVVVTAPDFPTELEIQKSNPLKYRYRTDLDGHLIWQESVNSKVIHQLGSVVNTDFTLNTVVDELMPNFNFTASTKLVSLGTVMDLNHTAHVRFQQTYKGVKVLGGEWIYHMENNEVVSGNGKLFKQQDMNVIPSLSFHSAEEKVINHGLALHQHHKQSTQEKESFLKKHLNLELVIDYNLKDYPVLCYWAEVRPDFMHVYHVWIDAHTGEVIKQRDQLCSIDGPKTASATTLNNKTVTLHTYERSGATYLMDASRDMFNASQSNIPNSPVGGIQTLDARNGNSNSYFITSTTNTWTDKSAVSAHYNAGLAYEYFKQTHSRNSINGSGGTITSVVNVSDDDGGGLDNAYWNGFAMFYGNGRNSFKPLAGGLDVAGHELTHGVISNSANLVYENQSGAINESMADIFGAMIDRDDWQLGEDIVKSGVYPSGAMRDLSNPHNGGSKLWDRGYQPEKMSEFYTGSQDNGGVHINSGIPNKAYYLIATEITKTKAEKIYYRALTVYLTSQSQFLDLRYAVEQSAKDLYGDTEAQSVRDAFDAVEIFDPNAGNNNGGGGGSDDIPANPGTQFVISADVNPADANTLYRSNTAGANYLALTQLDVKRRISVTDDGSVGYVVTNSNRLYRIDLDDTPTETLISSDDWDNAAVSKDGKLLALITTETDSSIYIYDFDTEKFKQFKLYNPTYSEGINAGGVHYADALEFDVTGQYVLYDALNVIENSTGADIEYWDVGTIRVWDNKTDDWGDGKVDKIFTQLPSGISIGNATYAKNSPDIIAFDYINQNAGTTAVMARDRSTNKTETIYSGNKLGFPSYSTDDDQMLFDAYNTLGDEVIGIIDLNGDKITISGSPSVLIEDAKWGVWYADGERSLLSDKKEIKSFAFPGIDGATAGVIDGLNISVEVPAGTNLSALTPTFTHSANADVSIGNVNQVSGVTENNFTTTVTYTITAQDESTASYKVTVEAVGVASVVDVEHQIKVYPNPAKQNITIEVDHVSDVSILDLLGREVIHTQTPAGSHQVDLSGLKSGVYYVRLTDGTKTIQLKLIKQ